MKKFKTPQEYIDFAAESLESANHHGYIELPEKLFNKIKDIEGIDEYNNDLELARIIAEEFCKNI